VDADAGESAGAREEAEDTGDENALPSVNALARLKSCSRFCGIEHFLCHVG
jgi:hypothetical protein